jgi:hypothetical protein
MDRTFVFVQAAIGETNRSTDSATHAAYPQHLTSSYASQCSAPARRGTAGRRSARLSALASKRPGNGTQARMEHGRQSGLLHCRIGLAASTSTLSSRRWIRGEIRKRARPIGATRSGGASGQNAAPPISARGVEPCSRDRFHAPIVGCDGHVFGAARETRRVRCTQAYRDDGS